MNNEKDINPKGLCVLGGSDFEVVDGQSDIRGWNVKDQNGKMIGDADELIFDPNSRTVRYIVVDLESNDLGLDERKVLVPIGIATLHENDDEVILPATISSHLSNLPDFDEDNIDRQFELSVRNAFSAGTAQGSGASDSHVSDEDFYRHAHFDNANLYRNRSSYNALDNPGSLRSRGENSSSNTNEEDLA
jgi:hypothetical protein